MNMVKDSRLLRGLQEEASTVVTLSEAGKVEGSAGNVGHVDPGKGIYSPGTKGKG
jgi:hypothetical protein